MSLNRLKGYLRLSAVRQTLWLLVLFGGITALAWGGTYWLVQREMLHAVDDRLSVRMQTTLMALEAGQPLPAPAPGQTATITTNDWRDGFLTVDPHSRGPEMRYLMQTTPHGRILLGENTERQEELQDILAGGMQVTLLVTLLATMLAGLWMARRGQSRVNTISAGLVSVAQGNLDTRIALSGPDDDLSLLAERINTTTDRLDHAMTQMRVQSSNIAHDLRTPLARLRAQIETSLIALSNQNRPVTPDDLGAALEQIDHITGTFNALLRLARIESGAGREAFVYFDLGTLANDVAETFGPVVEDANQSLILDITDAGQVTGDHDMLVQLLANLIQNALRYGPDGQEITLRVRGLRLSVSDQGPGVPFAEREKVLQPLYQGENTRQGPGFGLGLSLVRAISDLHKAELSLSDGPEGCGLTVTVQFPELTNF